MVGVLLSLPTLAQDLPSSASETSRSPWTLSATASEESIGQGLPVLALGRDDWPSYRSGQSSHPRAWRSLQAELSATHPSGWRISTLARAEAWLRASPDAVTTAALEATKSEPETGRPYELNASSQSWQGQGVRVGTPWMQLDAPARWHWQADVQLLRLQRLRTIDLSGNVSYLGGNAYDFKLRSQRFNPGITDTFLPPSGSSGLGSSLSVALQGEPAVGWQVHLRADDLLSRLDWPDMASDTALLNSQVTSCALDGSLDYAPLIKGQKALMHIRRRIGVHWQAKASWSAFAASSQPGMVTLRADRKAGLSQYWLGWDSGDAGYNRLRWNMALEPVRRVASLGLAWGGWHALLATDGKGIKSEFRYLRLGWQGKF
jgi:hypothetical protein